MISLDRYIKSRLHGWEDNWTRDQWVRSREASTYFSDKDKAYPFPSYLRNVQMRADYETPAPSLFAASDTTDWFMISRWHPEIRLEVDFEPAPSLGTIYTAFHAARGEAELLVTGFAGEEPGTFDIGIEALYVVKGRGLEGPLSDIFGHEPNGYMDHGWEWFSGWP